MSTPTVNSLMRTAINGVVNTSTSASQCLAPAGICGVYFDGQTYYSAQVFGGTCDPLPTETTAFGLGSVTKTFTTSVIGQLGASTITDPIKGNIPKAFTLQSAAEEWTLSQLASFISGLPRYPENSNRKPLSAADWDTYVNYLDSFIPPSLPAAYDYSNISIGLASQIAMPIGPNNPFNAADTLAWWKKNLLEPVGMTDTGAFDKHGGTTVPGDPTPTFVTPYTWQNNDYAATSYAGWCPWGTAGRAYSTCQDMLSFVQALVGETKVNGKTIPAVVADGIALAQTPVSPPVHPFNSNHSVTQALAWTVDASNSKGTFVAKDGGVRGVSSYITACPALQLGAVLLTNLQGVAVQPASKHLTNGLIDLAR